ncbi:MAG: methyltransferase domain-containing protein [Planctomycetota bacterium]|jgi:ubiquinone/menaquinone biosynthesis C-methylase UbiE
MSEREQVQETESRYDEVKEYYGQVLKKSDDLKTNACCAPLGPPAHIAEALELINDEIKDKYYGCGSPIPLSIEGLNILDLGCGTGRDCYVMSKLVGEDGFVTGIDMTENQLAVAKKYASEQMAVFGYTHPNVNFVFDYIENVQDHFEKGSLDIVTSNCVINLTKDKQAVLQQVYDVLKFGGEMYFSDVYADRRIPEKISRDPVLHGECLGGALYYKDFERIARRVGFTEPRIYSRRRITIQNEEIEQMVGDIRFYAITYRLWKLKGLEDACEDYGHVAVYNKLIPHSPGKLQLDCGHIFHDSKPERVCGNTALMLSQTRFNKYFEITGDFNKHFGLFEGCSNTHSKEQAYPKGLDCC